MKKSIYLLCTLSACIMSVPAFSGGLMTNTNYHIAFDRMMARGATFDIDAIYSNPAGLAWGHEGWQISFDVQKPFQYRDIEASLAQPFATAVGFTDYKFKGKASANPFVPALFASYKHDKWALGLMAGIVGSGGKVKYDEGVPQFVVPVRGMMSQIATNVNGALPPGYPAVPGNFYDLDAFMEGKQYIYGIQANFTYRFNDHWSAAAGLRANIYNGYSRGHVISATSNAVVMGAMGMTTNELLKLNLDVDQKGWGVNPTLSVNYRWKDLTLTGRYEFRTKLNIPNDTKALEVAAAPALAGQVAAVAPMTAPYQDGVKTRYDMPGLLSLAAGYEFIPNKLRATLEYHWFDDKNAKMQGNRQEQLSHGTQEFLAGIEWDINKTFTVSCGAQRTDYGLTDQYQTNTSFACDSYSVGLGGAVNITSHLRVNLGYFCSIYSDYTRQANYMNIPLTETYSRTNHVFGVGVDYKF
jgi:long-chain fatty acid transport protein